MKKDIRTRQKAIINKAKEFGSKAKTLQGAHKAIQNFHNQLPPIYKRGEKVKQYCRTEENKQQYLNEKHASRFLQWEISQCHAAGKLHPTEIEKRKKKRDENICERIRKHLAANWPLKRSQSSWAGGEHFITVKIGFPNCRGYSFKAWSDNGKWSGTDSDAFLSISRRTLKHFPNATAQDGAIILDAKKLSAKEYKIVFVKQGCGFKLNAVDGYMIKGYLSTATTIERARKQVADARKKAIIIRLQQRAKKLDFIQLKKRASSVFVSVPDSLRAGNCEAMSNQLADKIRRDLGPIEAVRGDILLDYQSDHYAQKAIIAAMTR